MDFSSFANTLFDDVRYDCSCIFRPRTGVPSEGFGRRRPGKE